MPAQTPSPAKQGTPLCPWDWLDEPEGAETEARGFGPDVSEAPLASRLLHVRVSSDKGVQFDDERGERRGEEFDSGQQSGLPETSSSCGTAPPSLPVSELQKNTYFEGREVVHWSRPRFGIDSWWWQVQS